MFNILKGRSANIRNKWQRYKKKGKLPNNNQASLKNINENEILGANLEAGNPKNHRIIQVGKHL